MTNCIRDAHAGVLDALQQVSQLLIDKLNRFVDVGPENGEFIELVTRASVVKIQQRLEALVAKLGEPGPLDEEAKLRVAGNLFDLLAAANSASHGVGNIVAFLEQSKVSAAKIGQAKTARESKKATDAANRLKLKQAIKDEARHMKITVAVSTEFARQARPGVCLRLGLKPDERSWLSESTIKNAAREIRNVGQYFKR